MTQYSRFSSVSSDMQPTQFAVAALPDVSVIDAGEDAAAAARDLVAYWEREASAIGETLSNCAADQLSAYRAACVEAVADRIRASRA